MIPPGEVTFLHSFFFSLDCVSECRRGELQARNVLRPSRNGSGAHPFNGWRMILFIAKLMGFTIAGGPKRRISPHKESRKSFAKSAPSRRLRSSLPQTTIAPVRRDAQRRGMDFLNSGLHHLSMLYGYPLQLENGFVSCLTFTSALRAA